MVLGYKLTLCHNPIKPDLLGFLGIGVFACGLREHVITRFASHVLIVSHSYQTYFGFPISNLNLDCGLRDYNVRINDFRLNPPSTTLYWLMFPKHNNLTNSKVVSLNLCLR
jgi:hypothetical protein